MTTRDLKSNIDIVTSLAPAARTATASGTGVDLRGYESAVATFVTGTVTDGTHTPSVEESDDDSTYTAVAAADLLGSLADLASDTVQRVGYRGGSRYIRAKITASGTTTGALDCAVVIRGNAVQLPLA
ncbi:MAG: hypothetical protein IIB67_12995 [Proteobacteria bacterium]|nr:hypothetical protein [Pseudomonadota bacterium]